jgi:hypothetical protein
MLIVPYKTSLRMGGFGFRIILSGFVNQFLMVNKPKPNHKTQTPNPTGFINQ